MKAVRIILSVVAVLFAALMLYATLTVPAFAATAPAILTGGVGVCGVGVVAEAGSAGVRPRVDFSGWLLLACIAVSLLMWLGIYEVARLVISL